MQLQQSLSKTLLLGNHCLLCNLARLLDGVFDSKVYLLDVTRTCPSIVTKHLASSVTVQGKTPLPGFCFEVTSNLLEQQHVRA